MSFPYKILKCPVRSKPPIYQPTAPNRITKRPHPMISAHVFQLSGKKNSLLISSNADFYIFFPKASKRAGNPLLKPAKLPARLLNPTESAKTFTIFDRCWVSMNYIGHFLRCHWQFAQEVIPNAQCQTVNYFAGVR